MTQVDSRKIEPQDDSRWRKGVAEGYKLKYSRNCATIDSWRTPASNYPEATEGKFRIKKIIYKPGYYDAFGAGGKLAWYTNKELVITTLQGKQSNGIWYTYMVDDPPHLWANASYAEQASGKVLLAGLGLGLVNHELEKNPLVTDVTVVEIEQNVASLVAPYLPKRTVVVVDDFFNFVKKVSTKFDTVLMDIDLFTAWDTHNENGEHTSKKSVEERFPGAKILYHGYEH